MAVGNCNTRFFLQGAATKRHKARAGLYWHMFIVWGGVLLGEGM